MCWVTWLNHYRKEKKEKNYSKALSCNSLLNIFFEKNLYTFLLLPVALENAVMKSLDALIDLLVSKNNFAVILVCTHQPFNQKKKKSKKGLPLHPWKWMNKGIYLISGAVLDLSLLL